MSSILLIILIIISLLVIFYNSAFQSEIKISRALEYLYIKDLSGLKQFNLLKLDKSFGIIKSSRNTLIQRPLFPQL
jgi:hypothetical protein